jgi:hypothetical protein
MINNKQAADVTPAAPDPGDLRWLQDRAAVIE